jgi:hypothetical protein
MLTWFQNCIAHRGFRRDFYRTLPKKALAFLHPQFQKGKPQLLREMKISTSTSQIVDSSDDEEEEKKPVKKESSSSSDGSDGGGRKPRAVPSAARGSVPNPPIAAQQISNSISAPNRVNAPGQQGANPAMGWQPRPVANAALLNPQAQQLAALSSQFLNPQLGLLQAGLFQPNTLPLGSQLLQQGNGLLPQEAALLHVSATKYSIGK